MKYELIVKYKYTITIKQNINNRPPSPPPLCARHCFCRQAIFADRHFYRQTVLRDTTFHKKRRFASRGAKISCRRVSISKNTCCRQSRFIITTNTEEKKRTETIWNYITYAALKGLYQRSMRYAFPFGKCCNMFSAFLSANHVAQDIDDCRIS